MVTLEEVKQDLIDAQKELQSGQQQELPRLKYNVSFLQWHIQNYEMLRQVETSLMSR